VDAIVGGMAVFVDSGSGPIVGDTVTDRSHARAKMVNVQIKMKIFLMG
jgi:hypothetical protein